MGKIHRLDEHLANMIAAGEVVERPSAALKELVENALDAQATRLEIRLVDGGIERLEVHDDGEGMDAEDLRQAFERHSTSKIRSPFDLFAPKTLGFRGEALPSIASVAKVTATSCDGKDSHQLQISYGTPLAFRPVSRPQGTSIVVEGLFRKTPARLKHLKSVAYETSLCVDLVEKMALGRPDVAFKVVANDEIVLNTTGRNDLLETLAMTYGNKLARQAHPFSVSDHDFTVSGCWIEPQENRANNKSILVFLNHRLIRFFPLQKAVTEAYGSYLPPHRYPIVLLHVSADPSLADVNVHPSKWEVKLSKEGQLCTLVADHLVLALRTTFQAKPLSRPLTESFTEQVPLFDVVRGVDPLPPLVEVQEESPLYRHPTFPMLDVVGQLHGRYIVASDPETVYFIDQHAAKERINYEALMAQLNERITDHQELLVPLSVPLKPSFIPKIPDFLLALASLGLEAERLSDAHLVVRRVPLWLKAGTQEAFLAELVERFDEEKTLSLASLRHAALATTACHQSIRFNQQLTMTELRHIVDELSHCQQPYHCPHGRPTLIKIRAADLWKDFDR